MPLIEGFGDEVTLLLAACLIGIVLVFAWMSTQVDSRFLVPIIVLDRDRFAALMQRLRGLTEQRLDASENISGSESSTDSTEPSAEESGTEVDAHSPSQIETLAPEEPSPMCEPSAPNSLHECAASNHVDNSDARSNESAGLQGKPIQPQEGSSLRSDANRVAESDVNQAAESGSCSHEPDVSDSVSSNQSQNSRGSESETIVPEGHIQVRLQYIDGRQRVVSAKPDDTVGEFKRNHFSAELAGHSVVRFVMSGQELRNESLTLRSYRVSDGSVIHCLVTQARTEPIVTNVDSHHFEIGFLMLPLFGFILTLLWYARISYQTYFSGTSTFSLVAISFLYLIALFGSFRSNRANHPHQD